VVPTVIGEVAGRDSKLTGERDMANGVLSSASPPHHTDPTQKERCVVFPTSPKSPTLIIHTSVIGTHWPLQSAQKLAVSRWDLPLKSCCKVTKLSFLLVFPFISKGYPLFSKG
jgi:hypothetical protein